MMFETAAKLLDYALLFITTWWPSLAIVVLTIAVGHRWQFATLRRYWREAAKRPIVAASCIAALSLLSSLTAAGLHGRPRPADHDGHAYVLAGDIFAAGHASFPSHPLWPHFETMHTLMAPRYVPKFPPGQGVLLAMCRAIFGVPAAALFLAAAAACVAVYWALLAVLPPSWAFLGGLMLAIHPTMLRWSQDFHPGALAALGGALLVGAVLRRDWSMKEGVACGAGLVILSVSRPYEGFVLAIACGLVLIFRRPRIRWQALTACALITLAGLTLLGAYNYNITGNVLVLPYSIYERQYDPVPNFIWEAPRPLPHYRNQELEDQYRFTYLRHYQRVMASRESLIDELWKKAGAMRWTVFPLPPRPWLSGLYLILFAPLLMLWRVDRRALFLAAGFAFAPFSIVWWMTTHYLAPATVVAAIILIMGLRGLAAWRPTLAAVVVALFVAISVWRWVDFARLPETSPQWNREVQREQIVASLERGGGQHLILVPPDVRDVVYNRADIDRASVIWARELPGDDDARLLAYYRNLAVWRARDDDGTLRVTRLR